MTRHCILHDFVGLKPKLPEIPKHAHQISLLVSSAGCGRVSVVILARSTTRQQSSGCMSHPVPAVHVDAIRPGHANMADLNPGEDIWFSGPIECVYIDGFGIVPLSWH